LECSRAFRFGELTINSNALHVRYLMNFQQMFTAVTGILTAMVLFAFLFNGFWFGLAIIPIEFIWFVGSRHRHSTFSLFSPPLHRYCPTQQRHSDKSCAYVQVRTSRLLVPYPSLRCDNAVSRDLARKILQRIICRQWNYRVGNRRYRRSRCLMPIQAIGGAGS
jgi:hypothetical protein